MLDTIEICTTNAQAQPMQPTATVIWMNGLGADGHDFVPVVEMLDLPHIRFILPHAPHQPITLNQGYAMRAWYDIISLDKHAAQDEAGIIAMQAEINAMIAQEVARGIPAQRIVLAGFSQGGAMALVTASRHPARLAGVLALSTYLPLAAQHPTQVNPANQHTPIWMAHGLDDSVITLATAMHARDVLRAAGAQVEWHTYDMAHTVIASEIADIRQFLCRVLPA